MTPVYKIKVLFYIYQNIKSDCLWVMSFFLHYISLYFVVK